MNEKKKFPISKILFVILYIFMVAIFLSTAIDFATKSKFSKYYTNEVFPSYRDYVGDNDEYLDKLVTYYNGYYDKENPMFEETVTATENNPLQFKIAIYRARFKITNKTFLFFKKTFTTDAYIIQFKDIKYGDKDLVQAGTRPTAAYDLKEVPEILKIKLAYNQSLDVKGKNTIANYEDYIDAARPFIFIANNLKLSDNTLASVTSISVVREIYDEKDAKDGTKERDLKKGPVKSEFLYSATDTGAAHIGSEITHKSPQKLLINEQTIKFADESKVKLQAPDVAKYNGSMTVPVLIAVILSIVFGYFMFFHKLVKERLAEKRTQKAIEAREHKEIKRGIIRNDLGDDHVVEGDFEETFEDDQEETNDEEVSEPETSEPETSEDSNPSEDSEETK